MSTEKLRKYIFRSMVTTATSGVIELVVLAAIVRSTKVDTWMTDAPKTVVWLVAFAPFVVMWAAIAVNQYYRRRLKEAEGGKESERDG